MSLRTKFIFIIYLFGSKVVSTLKLDKSESYCNILLYYLFDIHIIIEYGDEFLLNIKIYQY